MNKDYESYKILMNSFKSRWFQTFDDAKQGRGSLVKSKPSSSITEADLQELNLKGAGVFMCPNGVEGTARTEANVKKLEYAFVDMDKDAGTKEEQMVKIKNAPLEPTFVVESKNGYHCYYRCDIAPDYWDAVISGVVQYFDGDEALLSKNEVLRVPGFYHKKDGDEGKFLVKMVSVSNKRYAQEELLEKFPYVPPIVIFKKRHNLADNDLGLLRDIPIKEVLRNFGVLVKANTIWENGEETSAHINVKKNNIKRFSGKSGGGSTIDVAMHYGGFTLPEAINWLRKEFNMPQVNQEVDSVKLVKIPDGGDMFERLANFKFEQLKLGNFYDPYKLFIRGTVLRLGGYSNMGKSTLAYNWARMLLAGGYKGVIFSSEVVVETVCARLVQSIDGCFFHDVINHKRTPSQKARDLMKDLRIFDGRDHRNKIIEVESRIKSYYPDFVVIDFCQAMKDRANSKNEYEAMTNWALEIQEIAQKYNCAIIDLSQLSNDSVKNDYSAMGHIPFKGSGALYFSADIGVMIKRNKQKSPDLMDVHVRKHKYNKTFSFGLKVDWEMADFKEDLGYAEVEKEDKFPSFKQSKARQSAFDCADDLI